MQQVCASANALADSKFPHEQQGWSEPAIMRSGHHSFDVTPPVIMAKNNFKEYICLPYCIFFKEGKMEEITCRGARIIEFLVNRRLIDVTKIPALIKAPDLWKKHKEYLENRVCSRCSFRANDCDFQSDEPSDDLEPCGGFILLALLKENNLIDELDLEHYRE